MEVGTPRVLWVSYGFGSFGPRLWEGLRPNQVKNLERLRRRDTKALNELVDVMVSQVKGQRDFIWELPADA